MKKKLIYLLTLFLMVSFSNCGSDDPEVEPTSEPTLSLDKAEVTLNSGESDTFILNLSVEAGVSQFTVSGVNESVATITLSSQPAVGDISATISGTINAVANGQFIATMAVQDAEGRSEQVTLSVTVIKGYDETFASTYEFLTLRPEYKDYLFLLDKSGRKEAYNNEVFEGNSDTYGDYYLQETFFFFEDGWLDEMVSLSPFLDSRDDISVDLAAGLFNNSRFQQRDNDAGAPVYRNNLNWATIVGSNAATPDNTNTITGNTMNVRNRGIIGGSYLFQTFARPFAYGANQMGYLDAASGTVPTFTSDAIATDVQASVFDVTGVGSVPHIFIHAFDGFPIDLNAAFDDPQAYVDNVSQGRSRNFRDVSILQNVYLMDPDVKWTMNAIQDDVVAYSGSSAMYGAVIVSTEVYEELNAIISAIDGNYAFGQKRTTERWGDQRTAWHWDNGAGHIPEAVYGAASEYWMKHWIPTETVEDGSLADGSYPNFLGDDITVSGSTVTLGDTTANIIKRVRYRDERTGRFDRAGDGSVSPSQEFWDKTSAQGYKYVEIIIVDKSL